MGLQIRLAVGTGAAMLALVVATAAAQTPATDQSAFAVAPTPEGAVLEAVATAGVVYAGDCSNTASPDNIGQVCSKFVAQRAATRAYLAGRAFSEFSTWVFVKQTGSGWVPLTTEPATDDASPHNVPWPAA